MSIATSEQSVVDSVNKQLFIGGEWRDASGGGTLAVEDPSTAEPLCEIADGTPEDAVAALGAATRRRPSGASTRRASGVRSSAAPSRRWWSGPTSSPS